jgi:tetratricopeptide (TPR) repeat protein
MNSKRNLALHCLLFAAVFYLSAKGCYAQNSTDSLAFYSKLVMQPQSASDLEESYLFFDSKYKKALRKNQNEQAINYLYYLSSIAYKRGRYEEAELKAVNAQKLIDKLPTSEYEKAVRKSFYNLLGIIYEEQQNEDKALELYNTSLGFAETASDSAIIYNNISNVYKQYRDTLRAEKSLAIAFGLRSRIEDSLIKALIYDNYGVIKNDRNENGLPLMRKALDIREKEGDSSKIYLSYTSLAEYYYKKGDSVQSKTYARSALDIARKLESPTYINYALGILTALSKDPYAVWYKRLNDSLIKVERNNKNRFALIRYDVAKKDKALLQSQRNNERMILVLLILVVSTIALFIYLRIKHNKEKLQQVLKTESNISKQIHDELANSVFQVMTRLEQNGEKDESILDELDLLYKKTRDISKEYAQIDDPQSFDGMLRDLIGYFKNKNTNILVKGMSNVNWLKVPSYKLNAVYKVLQELLVNMKKHSQASLVVLNFNQNKGKLSIEYTDNGIGGPIKKGRGLQNAENRISAIGGRFNFESKPMKGFKVQLYV